MVIKTVFGKNKDKICHLYKITNSHGMEVGITELGAIITSIKVPDGDGRRELVLGFDSLEEYFSEAYQQAYPYLGAIIGRNAGRISFSKFQLGGTEFRLSQNMEPHHLHGGKEGFDRKFWTVQDAADNFIVLSYKSADGEEGYPGNVQTFVKYTLSENNELKVEMFAETDAETVVNLTQHTYFNFNRNSSGDVLSHQLQVLSQHYVPLNDELLPTGEILPVEGTIFNYKIPKNPDSQLDISFPLRKLEGGVAGMLQSPDGKVKMTVTTTQPILHIYTGFYLPDVAAAGRKTISSNAGICFETQGFADAPNHQAFLSTILKPGEKYRHETIFKFEF